MRWLLAFLTLAQSQFDVVSVKPSAPDEHNSFMFRPLPGGLRAAGVPLKMLIMESYDVKAFQVSGGPGWIATDRWDILAKFDGVDGQIPLAQMRPMLQAMMADRFKLKSHKETKEMPVYALVVEKNGLKMANHTGAERQFRPGDGSLIVKKGGTAALATWLSRQLGRVVIDKTDLTGEYDYKLEWTPDPRERGPESIGLPPEPPRQRAETNGPSIFTAVQEQLGLRLVSQKGPVEIVVIDSVEKPSAN
ncbi:MAG TPA: TIGR03435 family protein [Bryobacteraceae bacterium]|nr:TIGR03435 family protein [Bryobacteraceae bacterium]